MKKATDLTNPAALKTQPLLFCKQIERKMKEPGNANQWPHDKGLKRNPPKKEPCLLVEVDASNSGTSDPGAVQASLW